MTAKKTPVVKEVPVETITYPTAEVNKVLNYLGSRPYTEVAGLIAIMQAGKVDDGKK